MGGRADARRGVAQRRHQRLLGRVRPAGSPDGIAGTPLALRANVLAASGPRRRDLERRARRQPVLYDVEGPQHAVVAERRGERARAPIANLVVAHE